MPLFYDTIIYKICICQKRNRIETRVSMSKGAQCCDVVQTILKLTIIFVRITICVALRVLRVL